MPASTRFTRRRFNTALAAGGLAAFGPVALRPSFAATDVYWMGWQGYDECFHATDYLEANGVTFNTTYINCPNEEVLTKLQAGGLGKYDITTMYFGYLHLMAQSGLIQPIDEGKVQVLVEDKILPEFRRPRCPGLGRQAVGSAVDLGHAPHDVRPGRAAYPARALEGPVGAAVQGQDRDESTIRSATCTCGFRPSPATAPPTSRPTRRSRRPLTR